MGLQPPVGFGGSSTRSKESQRRHRQHPWWSNCGSCWYVVQDTRVVCQALGRGEGLSGLLLPMTNHPMATTHSTPPPPATRKNRAWQCVTPGSFILHTGSFCNLLAAFALCLVMRSPTTSVFNASSTLWFTPEDDEPR